MSLPAEVPPTPTPMTHPGPSSPVPCLRSQAIRNRRLRGTTPALSRSSRHSHSWLSCPLLFPSACCIVGRSVERKRRASCHLTGGGRMSDPREGEEFFLNVPEKLVNPFPDLQYSREHRPVFCYPPLQTWFIFRYDGVTALFHDARLSADRMKGFVDAAPAAVRDELRALGDDERWT